MVFTGKNFMRNLLAVIITAAGFALLYTVIFGHVSADKKETVTLILGFVFSIITQIIQYFFGTSQSSTDKNEMLKNGQS